MWSGQVDEVLVSSLLKNRAAFLIYHRFVFLLHSFTALVLLPSFCFKAVSLWSTTTLLLPLLLILLLQLPTPTTTTTVLFMTLCLGLLRWVGTRRINHSEFWWSRDDGVAVASAEAYARYLHFASEDNHASTSSVTFLRAGCPSWHRTNSPKALKGCNNHISGEGNAVGFFRLQMAGPKEPIVPLFPLHLSNRVTFDFDLLRLYESWPQLTWDWRSRSKVKTCDLGWEQL